MTCYQEITCPKCGGNDISKSGLSAHGVQRYRCQHPDCPTNTFISTTVIYALEGTGLMSLASRYKL